MYSLSASNGKPMNLAIEAGLEELTVPMTTRLHVLLRLVGAGVQDLHEMQCILKQSFYDFQGGWWGLGSPGSNKCRPVCIPPVTKVQLIWLHHSVGDLKQAEKEKREREKREEREREKEEGAGGSERMR